MNESSKYCEVILAILSAIVSINSDRFIVRIVSEPVLEEIGDESVVPFLEGILRIEENSWLDHHVAV